MRRATLPSALLFAMLAVASATDGHQLDEYLQATRIAIAADHLAIEIDLTPGVAIADGVIAAIDANGDGVASTTETDEYISGLVRNFSVLVDGRTFPMTIGRVEWPLWEAMRAGSGTIRVRARVATGPLSAGTHRIRVVNAYRPEISAYLINALLPADRAIAITSQSRDVRQHGIELNVEINRSSTSIAWTIAIACAFGVMIVKRGRPTASIGRLTEKFGSS